MGYYQKKAAKKGRKIPHKTIDIVQAFYHDNEYGRYLVGKEDKNVRLFVICISYMLHSREKNPNLKIWFSKFCSLCLKWCVIAGLTGAQSVCVCSFHQNTMLLVDPAHWDTSHKDLIKKAACNTLFSEYMTHQCNNCHDALLQFLDKQANLVQINISITDNGKQ